MRNDKFDVLIHELLELSYDILFQKNKQLFDDICKSTDITKYQKEINDVLIEIIENISKNKIFKENSEKSKLLILEILRKYVSVYFFLIVGLFQQSLSLFINRFIDFTRMQHKFNFKVDDFFNSDGINFIIEHIKLLTLVKNIKQKKPVIQNALFKKANQLIDAVKIEKFNDTELFESRIVKYTIIEFLYRTTGKNQIAELTNIEEDETNEYVYIDIVIPKNDTIDISSILMSLPPTLKKPEYANAIIELLNSEIESNDMLTYDEKILRLTNSKAIVPIVQDFLLYNKNSEKYLFSTINKKDTKIKYVIDKINTVKQLFSSSDENKKEKQANENLFIETLKHRRAIAVNDYEDLLIIAKSEYYVHNSETKTYYFDLSSYRKYAYVNFNEIENNNGFQLYPNKTINVVRDISITYPSRNEVSKYVESRTAIEGDIINVVGFFIPGGINDLLCTRSKNIIDVRNINTEENKKDGNANVNKLLKEINFKQNKTENGYYWFFDLNNDTLNTKKFNLVDFSDKTLVIKLMISEFYETILNSVEFAILETVTNILKSYPLTIGKLNLIIEHYENYFFPISRNSPFYLNLVEVVNYSTNVLVKSRKKQIQHSKHTKIILPVIKKKIDDAVIRIDDKKKPKNQIDEDSGIEYLCQHNYDWNNLSKSKYSNLTESFENLLYQFISTYVIYNESTSDSICRSCGYTIPLNTYVEGGHYSSSGSFIFDASALYIPLYSIKKYEHYGEQFINNLDFTFHKLATMFNINFYIGETRDIKLKREGIIKDVIDFIENDNYFVLKKKYTTRNSLIQQTYGINPSRTSLIYFELQNTLYSSVKDNEDLTKKKNVMQNVVIAYMITLLIMDIDEEQILGIKSLNEKICTFKLYEKFKTKIFAGMKIITNSSNTKHEILHFDTLCYTIFCFTCLITKYKVWKTEDITDKKYSFAVQIEAISTIVDIINNLMEVYCDKLLLKRNLLYKRILEKFTYKLNTLYNNDKIIDKIKNYDSKEISFDGKIIVGSFKKGLSKTTLIENIFKQREYQNSPHILNDIVNIVSFIKQKPTNDIYRITNISNCDDGRFHNFVTTNKIFSCSNCDIQLDVLQFNPSLTNIITEKYKSNVLSYLLGRYAIKLNEEQLKSELLLNNSKIIQDENDELKKTTEIEKERVMNITSIGKTLQEKYKNIITGIKTLEPHIDLFINGVENIVGKTLKMDGEYYFRNNIFTIDYMFNGHKLEVPYIIVNNDNTTKYIDNHTIFGVPVIQISLPEKNKMLMFFNANSRMFLGYKKQNDEIKVSDTTFKLKVSESLLNRIINLGIELEYVKFDNDMTIFDKEELLQTAITTRIHNLQKIIPAILTQFYRILNDYYESYKQKDQDEMLTEYDNIIIKEKKLYDKYHERFKKAKIISKNSTEKFMIKWKKVVEYDIPKDDPYVFSSEYFTSADIINNDKYGNYLLVYLVENLKRLIEINTNTSEKLVASFVIDVISENYTNYNCDNSKADIELNRFLEIIDNPIFVFDTMNSKLRKSKIINEDGTVTYTHINQIGNNDEDDVMNEDMNSSESKVDSYNDKEMNEAIDMDGTPYYEDND